MASLGAKVLQVRSVELAMVHGVRTFVRSSFDDPADPRRADAPNPPGTLICDEDEIVEQQVVTGIAYSKDEAQISLRARRRQAGRRRRRVRAAGRGQHQCRHDRPERLRGRHDHRHDLHRADGRRFAKVAGGARDRRKHSDRLSTSSSATSGMSKVSVIGIGMRSHAGVAATAFKALAGKRHQHPRHHHLRDQDLDPDRSRLHRAGGTDFAFALRPRLKAATWLGRNLTRAYFARRLMPRAGRSVWGGGLSRVARHRSAGMVSRKA